MPPPDPSALWSSTACSGLSPQRFLSDAADRIVLADLVGGHNLAAGLDIFHGRSVLISCHRQLPATLAFLELDGIARRILLCPPDLSLAHLPAVVAEAKVDVIVSDSVGPMRDLFPGLPIVVCRDSFSPSARAHDRRQATEWLLFTSGTTGRPKMVVHTLLSLTGPLDDRLAVASDAVWSTFYDVRRYGGLQILLRALLGGGSMVFSQAGETVADFLTRAGQSGVTHISGTPSHWRRALMSPAAGQIDRPSLYPAVG